jgi:hypothetical protein
MRTNLNRKSLQALMPHKEACRRSHSIAAVPASFVDMADGGSVFYRARHEGFRFLRMQAAAAAQFAVFERGKVAALPQQRP